MCVGMALAMPACWSDDERMNFLFQPFRPREANPESYDAKVKFWVELILENIKFQQESGTDGKVIIDK